MSYSTHLRDVLKSDFGIDVLLESGEGTRDDPYLIMPCPAAVAARTQLDLLRGLERGRGELWRTVRAETVAELGPSIQRIAIETVRFTADEVIRERRAYYFDLSQVGAMTTPWPLTVWQDPRTRFQAAAQVGWLHFDQAIDNSPGGPSLNTSLLYSCLGGKLGVYVYEPESGAPADPGERRARELSIVSAGIRHMHPEAVTPWQVRVMGPFATEWLLIGKDLSVVGAGVLGPHFIKFRLTFVDGPEMRELMAPAIQELAGALLAN